MTTSHINARTANSKLSCFFRKGKANKAIIALLAKALRLRKSQITLAAGETSPHKRFWIADETSDSLREKLQRLELS